MSVPGDPAEQDRDALWKPGGPEHTDGPSAGVDFHGSDVPASAPTSHRTWRWRTAARAAIVGALALCAVGAFRLLGGSAAPPTVSRVVDAMPTSVTELWSAVGPEFVSAADFSGDRDLVIAILDDGQPTARAEIIAIDGSSGDTRWRASVSLQPSQVDIVASIAGRVIVSVRRGIGTEELVAFDAFSGRTVWERRSPTGPIFTPLKQAGLLVQHDALGGRDATTVIDVESGATISTWIGRIERVDPRGVIEYVNQRSELVVETFADGQSTAETVATGVGTRDHAAVLADFVIVARSDGSVDSLDRSTGAVRRISTDLGAPRAVVEAGTDRVLVSTTRAVFGLVVSEEATSVLWSRDWTAVSLMRSDEALIVLAEPIEPPGRSAFRVLDGGTGLELTNVPIPNSGAEPIVASNGVMIRASNHLGGPIAGFGFDGQETWKLTAPAVTRFGDHRVIALTTDLSSGYVITAYGDLASPGDNG